MATVSAVILKDDQKQDGTWNVKIRIGHDSKSRYLDTPFFVDKSSLDKKGKIKNTYIIDRVAPILKQYRDKIADTPGIKHFTIEQVRSLLVESDNTEQIDFINFCETVIERKRSEGKTASAATFVTVVNGLRDYFKNSPVMITDITYNFLVNYEKFLRTPRKIIRQGNKTQVDRLTKVSDAGLHNHMRDLRLLFNAARDFYNDEDLGIIKIKHYPFKKYKVGQPPETEKRKMSVEWIKSFRDEPLEPGSRKELARDLYMLSFYLCGMNAADLYELEPTKSDRINYSRRKTRGKRRDKAFISIKIVDEARPLYDKYAGKLQERYSTHHTLDQAINRGMPEGVDFYSARHSFGDFARNICRFSMDDIGLAMNHKDRSNRTTDIYISKDWSIVDEVQAGVVGLLNQKSPSEGA